MNLRMLNLDWLFLKKSNDHSLLNRVQKKRVKIEFVFCEWSRQSVEINIAKEANFVANYGIPFLFQKVLCFLSQALTAVVDLTWNSEYFGKTLFG